MATSTAAPTATNQQYLTFAPTPYPSLNPTERGPTDYPTVAPTLHPMYSTTVFGSILSAQPTFFPAPPTVLPTPFPTTGSCVDGLLNGDETDVDCGGLCSACGLDQQCQSDSDCYDGAACQGGVCVDSPTAVPSPLPVPLTVLAIEKAAARIANSAGIVGDGRCDDEANSEEFNFDGGDCCVLTCVPNLFACQATQFNCKDPVTLEQELCPVKRQKNGKCNVGVHNTLQCGYDSGDCCRDTCTGTRCSDPEVNGGWHHCKDPASEQLKGAYSMERKLQEGIGSDKCSARNSHKLGDGHCDPVPPQIPHYYEIPAATRTATVTTILATIQFVTMQYYCPYRCLTTPRSATMILEIAAKTLAETRGDYRVSPLPIFTVGTQPSWG
jgi:hypothetical protein